MRRSVAVTRVLGIPLLLLLGTTESGLGQDLGSSAGEVVVVEAQPEAYGTTSQTVLVIGIQDMHPPISSTSYGTIVSLTEGVSRFQNGGAQTQWWISLHLPNGAILDQVAMEACDITSTGQLFFGIARGATPGGAMADISSIVGTGVAAMPGCAFFNVSPTVLTTIDNASFNYWIFYTWAGDFTPALKINSFRVRYRLQVSPSPGVATFPIDVPTNHTFFRFVEALAAAGITSGCGAGSYCPDQAVTRGQMAVFLSVALGLHFPN